MGCSLDGPRNVSLMLKICYCYTVFCRLLFIIKFIVNFHFSSQRTTVDDEFFNFIETKPLLLFVFNIAMKLNNAELLFMTTYFTLFGKKIKALFYEPILSKYINATKHNRPKILGLRTFQIRLLIAFTLNLIGLLVNLILLQTISPTILLFECWFHFSWYINSLFFFELNFYMSELSINVLDFHSSKLDKIPGKFKLI